MGVWNEQGSCEDIFPNMINSIFSKLLIIEYEDQEMVLVSSEKVVKILDL
jgi:hypothetical protein